MTQYKVPPVSGPDPEHTPRTVEQALDGRAFPFTAEEQFLGYRRLSEEMRNRPADDEAMIESWIDLMVDEAMLDG